MLADRGEGLEAQTETLSFSVTCTLFPFFFTCVLSCLNESQCYDGVQECGCQCSVSRGMQGCFLILSTSVRSVTPEVLLHPNISGAAVSTVCLNDHNSEKNSLFLSPCWWESDAYLVHRDLSDLGKKGVIVWMLYLSLSVTILWEMISL